MKKVFPFLFVILSCSKGHQELVDKKLAECTTAIRLDPDDACAYVERGSIYDDLGKYNIAIADFTTAIRLDPDGADGSFCKMHAYHSRGITYMNLGEYNTAIADFTTYFKLNPDGLVHIPTEGGHIIN